MATEVKIPNLGDFKDVSIVEVHVNAGDPLVSLEADKVTMEIPALQDGIVEKLLIKVGDSVSKGTPILLLLGATPT